MPGLKDSQQDIGQNRGVKSARTEGDTPDSTSSHCLNLLTFSSYCILVSNAEATSHKNRLPFLLLLEAVLIFMSQLKALSKAHRAQLFLGFWIICCVFLASFWYLGYIFILVVKLVSYC